MFGMIGLIPAAGKGTRLGDLGKRIHKSLVKINNITLLERAINNLKKANVSKIIVIVGYKKEQIILFLNSKDFGVRIETIFQEEQRGLAHAILQAEAVINEPFIIQLPDNIIEADFSNLINEFFKNNADFIQFYKEVNNQQDSLPTLLIKNNLIIEITKYYKGNKGYKGVPIYIIKPIFFNYCNKLMKNLKPSEELRETDVMLEMIKDKRKVMAIKFDGKLTHITTNQDLKREQI